MHLTTSTILPYITPNIILFHVLFSSHTHLPQENSPNHIQSKIIQKNDMHNLVPQRINNERKKDIHHTRVEFLLS
jgi:hypothetical protein